MLPACESPTPPYALSDNRRKPLGHESPIGPCIATDPVDNRQACVSETIGAVTTAKWNHSKEELLRRFVREDNDLTA